MPLVLTMLVASFGVCSFERWARHAYLVSRVAVIALLPLLSPGLVDRWTELIEATAYLSSGIVIALMYWSPLRTLYERRVELQEAM